MDLNTLANLKMANIKEKVHFLKIISLFTKEILYKTYTADLEYIIGKTVLNFKGIIKKARKVGKGSCL
jgi:hypothetical protein